MVYRARRQKGHLLNVDKNSLRIQYLAKRARLTPEVAEKAAHAFAAALAPLVTAQAVVGGYVPFRGELDVRPAMAMLAARGHSLCMPVIESADNPLYFRRWRESDVLEQGRYGIPIPPAGAPVFRPEVLLVPLVAFDRKGHRLGYGAGYYDRTIERLRALNPQTLVVGAAFAVQEVPALPAAAHDQRLDMIISENEIIRMS